MKIQERPILFFILSSLLPSGKQVYPLAVIAFLFTFHLSCFSQDFHFSQNYMTPLIVNPALTGVFPGNERTIVNHKNQWSSFGAPYKTSAFSFDASLYKKKRDNSYLGVGITMLRDVSGDAELGTTQLNAALSGILLLNDKNSVSVGIMGGFGQHSINGNNFRWGNQFTNGKFDPGQSSNEPTQAFEPFLYGDAGVGVTWNYSRTATDISKNNGLDLNAGIAAFHLNRPELKYYELDAPDRLYPKLVAHAGALIETKNKSISLKPSLYYLRQGPAQEINLGIMTRFGIKEESKHTGFIKETAVSVGAYYRVGDAIIPALSFEFTKYAVSLTYDVNTSGLKEASHGRGGFEISLRFINPNPFKTTKGNRYRHRSLL